MKKTFIFLTAALFAMVACNQTVDVETPEVQSANELSFKAVSANATKAGELNGTVMPETYGIYVAASQKSSVGAMENPNFFTGTEQLFKTADSPSVAGSLWKAHNGTAFAPLYWPIGGVRMDFLAYALPVADHNDMAASAAAATDWTAFFNDNLTNAAKTLSFNGVDTYKNQVDVLYAAANDCTTAANAAAPDYVKMSFEHAQALLIFNVKVNTDAVITIDDIAFYTDERVDDMRADQVAVAGGAASALAALAASDVTLKTIGTFTVDNSHIDLGAAWSALATSEENYKMPDFGATPAVSPCNIQISSTDITATQKYGVAVAKVDAAPNYAQLGETLLIPEQDKQKFTISYTIGGNKYMYTYNDLRGLWQKGHKYIYNIDLTLNEIIITEEVADFDPSTQEVPLS